MGIIYSITNTVNGKMYIGQTVRSLASRISDHRGRAALGERKHKLYLAMRYFGLDKFEFKTLCVAPDSFLDELEIACIKQYKTYEDGYNMTYGGSFITPEVRKNLSDALIGRKVTWTDKCWATRRKNPNAKKPKDYVARGANNVNAASYLVRCPDGSEVRITGLNEFCKEHNLKPYAMRHILSGRQKNHRGYTVIARFND